MVKVKWRTLTQPITQGIRCLWFTFALPCIQILSKILSHLWRRITQDKQFALVFTIALALILIIIFGILPTRQNFEGNLLVRSLSFTNTDSDQLLIKDLRNLPEINLAGSQKFTLSGIINSPSHPQLNKLDHLDIELPNKGSNLTLTADNLSLKELRLQTNNRVCDLKYSSYHDRLSFALAPASPDPQNPRFLFEPGSSAINITLSDYKITNIPLASTDTPLEFSLQTTQFSLEPKLIADHKIEVNLTVPSDRPKNIFWSNLNVKSVKFEQFIQRANVKDEITDSSILSGEIRMAKQELKLEENQFLIIAPPGIQTLTRLQVVRPDPAQTLELKTSGDNLKLSDPPKGLNVSLSGTTTSIQAGLNPKVAIAQIQGSWLSRYVSHDVIVALISFSAGLIVSLLSWLFNNFDDSHRRSP